MAGSDGEVTRLLREWGRGDRDALEELAPLVQGVLRRIAFAQLRRRGSAEVDDPCALIGEVYLRLLQSSSRRFHDCTHFLAVAATCMRQILVDHARRAGSRRRGGGEVVVSPRTTVDLVAEARDDPASRLALHDALAALATIHARQARVLELRYFGGLTREEISASLGVHPRTVANDLRLGLAWLRTRLGGDPAT